MATDPATARNTDSAAGNADDDRGISVGRDASGNAFVTGDNNKVKIVIYQSVAERREPEPPTSPEIGPNPYMGLLAFHEQDADRFFGRDRQIARLWGKLRDLQNSTAAAGDQRHPRLLPILGPSGSGKSSLARAGLIPELARRPLPGWKDARVAVLTPGSHPIEALAGILARIATGDDTPVEKTEEFERVLKRKTDDGTYDGLRRVADALPEIASVPLVVLIDQFEEIYSLCDDKAERTAFVENLLCAASDPAGRVTVVITLRTDFLGETQTHEALNRVVCEQQVMVPAMSEAELRAAIARPAELAGHPLDDATISLLTADAKDREGALPLLQFALTRIWDGLTRGVPPAKTYEEIGGVGGALAGEAQRIYDGLGEAQKRIAKRVFLGLVQLGEGTRDTRRRAVVENLVSVGEDVDDVQRVIRRFAGRDARLITLSADESGAGDTAEVTHEALFDHWNELNQWLDDNREDIRFSRRLDEAARVWEEQGRSAGDLWRPPTLDLLREYHARVGNQMSPMQMDFFVASDRADEERIRKEKRQQIVMRGLLAVAASAAVIAIGMLVWALISRNAAVRTERLAQEGRIDALVDAILLAPPKTAGERIKTLTDVTDSESLRKYAVEGLNSTLSHPISEKSSTEEQDTLASAKANIAVALLKFGSVERFPRLLRGSADPALRSYLIHRISQVGSGLEEAEALAELLEIESDPSVRQALILVQGEFPVTRYLAANRERLIPKLIDWYRHDPDSGVHAASEWLLRHWKQEDQLKSIVGELIEDDRQLEARKSDDKRRWYINTQRQTMVIVNGPVEFRMGSPDTESGRVWDERLHKRKIDHSFAIADKEVTVEQFLRFRDSHDYDKDSSPSPDCPVNTVTWYEAAEYCNWLTEQEMEKSEAQAELCYVPNAEGEFAEGMAIAPDYLERRGYRLPTEAEWEYACRAGSANRFCFGQNEELLENFAWYAKNANNYSWPVGGLKPNDLGLFDVHGNMQEWCQNEYRDDYTTEEDGQGLTVTIETDRVLRGGSFVYNADYARSAYRFHLHPDFRWNSYGFRVARTYP